MARFKVRAPDGRTVTLEGDVPPTDAELDEIFANLPAPSAETAAASAEPAAEPAADTRLMPGYTDVPLGMVKGLGRTLLGAVKMSPGALATAGVSKLTGIRDPLGETVEAGREAMEPQTPGEKAGLETEQLAEFFVPGPGKTSSLLGAAAKAALESGLLGSAQAGEPNPEAAVGGAVGGALGKTASQSVLSIIKKLPASAIRQLVRLAKPDVGFEAEKVTRAVTAGLEEGSLGGRLSPDELVEQAASRTVKLKGPRDAYRAATDAKPVDAFGLARPLIEEAQQYVRRAEDGSIFFTNKMKFDQLMAQAKEILATRGKVKVGPVRTKTGDVEDILQGQAQQGKVYERVDPTKAASEEGVRLLREALNKANPGRAEAFGPFSDALAHEESLRTALGRKALAEPSSAGQQFAIRGGLGAAVGGGAGLGAVAAAEGAVQIGRYLKSPQFQSLSAGAKWKLAKALEAAAPEEWPSIAQAFMGAAGSERHTDESNQAAMEYILRKLNLKTPEAP